MLGSLDRTPLRNWWSDGRDSGSNLAENPDCHGFSTDLSCSTISRMVGSFRSGTAANAEVAKASTNFMIARFYLNVNWRFAKSLSGSRLVVDLEFQRLVSTEVARDVPNLRITRGHVLN